MTVWEWLVIGYTVTTPFVVVGLLLALARVWRDQ